MLHFDRTLMHSRRSHLETNSRAVHYNIRLPEYSGVDRTHFFGSQPVCLRPDDNTDSHTVRRYPQPTLPEDLLRVPLKSENSAEISLLDSCSFSVCDRSLGEREEEKTRFSFYPLRKLIAISFSSVNEKKMYTTLKNVKL